VILEKPMGLISCKWIAEELRLRNQPVSGWKHEIAKRLCVAEMPRLPQLHQKMSLSQ
jgi:hypothetical protein